MTTVTVAEAKKLLQNLPSGVRVVVDIDIMDGVITLSTDRNTIAKRFSKYSSKDELLQAEYRKLRGRPITLSDAADKYNVPRSVLSAWHYRSKYITPLGNNYPMTFDEAEIAYLVDIYNERRRYDSKAPLVDETGLPYELKHPDLAAYRRKRKTGPLAE